MHEELPEEAAVRVLLERELGRSLRKVQPTIASTVDYRAIDGALAVEVKRITSWPFLQLSAEFARNTTAQDDSRLTGRWWVMVDAPTLSDLLPPVPDFPPDPDVQAQIDLAGLGFRFVPRDERIADHRRRHPPEAMATVRLRGLANDLVPHLVTLEQHGIDSTRCEWTGLTPGPIGEALLAIAQRTRNALCMRHSPVGEEAPGVDTILASGTVRTELPETIVERIKLWFASTKSENLKASLRNEPTGTERHAALLFDSATEPEWVAAEEHGVLFAPSGAIDLPAEVDVLWVMFGSIAWRYATRDGWTAMSHSGLEE